MSDLPLTIIRSQSRKMPRLSVLIPFYKDNPAELLSEILIQAEALRGVEILIYDDGTLNAEICADLAAQVKAAKAPVTLMIAEENRGRASGRNTLQEKARGKWVLFLDADMRPGSPDFLKNYLALIEADTADIIFGGFTVPRTAKRHEELHRALSEVSDCLPFAERQAAGPQYVATSNLCVRKSVLLAEPFDSGFIGWGWEDSEWAARVSKRFVLQHADNTAIHLGLESDDTLLARFKNSAMNYKRFTDTHPELAQTLTLYRLTQKLRRYPAQRHLRPLMKLVVKVHAFPIRMRVIALKFWRASWYAELKS
jgi:glycosyltransferase involved in cell wall biosynthesis